MTKKEFFNHLGGGKDILAVFLGFLAQAKSDYCVIGGLAVNAYAEPLVSLDLDIVIVADKLKELEALAKGVFKVEHCPHAINLNAAGSDLRVQLQTDSRYQDFLRRAEVKDVLGYQMKVAAVEDVLQGKIWAYSDTTRRASKRQKDLADILRLAENYPVLKKILPDEIKNKL
jgi:hypothetical protein